jgi:hypothetical protein
MAMEELEKGTSKGEQSAEPVGSSHDKTDDSDENSSN